jgi:cholesterol transport system auxiliary component
MKSWTIQMVFVLLALTVAGCLSPRADSPPIHTYRLSLDAQQNETRPADSRGPVLMVSQTEAAPGFESAHMVYVKRLHELERFALNQWTEAPARMLTPLLIQSLERAGNWRAVVPLPGSVRGDYRLDSQGFSLQQEFLQQPSRVRATVRTQLVDLKESRLVGTKGFEAVEGAPTDDAYGGVLAANRAVAALLDQIASWLKTCMQQASACSR